MRQGGEEAPHPCVSPHPFVSPCVPQVVRAKERLDEELRIQAKGDKEKGRKAET